MDLIQSVSHTWSATIRMFPNNSRSAIPVKTKTKKIYFTLYLQQRSHRFHLAPSRTFTTEIQMAHLDRSPLLTPSSREASKQSFTRVSRFARVLQLIYVRNSSTTHLARSKKKKDYTVPSTLRACAVYRNSSTISRMTVGNGNLSVLDCSLDWQVKGKASIRLMTMQTTLAKLFILYYSFPHLPLTMTMTMTLKRIPSKSLYCAATQHKTPYWN